MSAPDPDPDIEGKRPKISHACGHCDVRLGTEDLLMAHIKLQHPSQPVICPSCYKQCPTMTEYERHQLSHRTQKPHCPSCGQVFATLALLKAHANPDTCESTVGGDTGIFVEGQEASTILVESSGGQTKGRAPSRRKTKAPQAEEQGDLYELKESLVGQHVRDQLQEQLQSIRQVVDLQFHSALPDTPTPFQQHLMGKNMRRFQLSQLIDPLPAMRDPSVEPSATLKHLLEQPVRRQLFAAVQLDQSRHQALTIRIKSFQSLQPVQKNDDYFDFDVNDLGFNAKAAELCGRNMVKLLQRLPVPLKEMAPNQKTWALFAARRLMFAEDRSLKINITKPWFVSATHKGQKNHFCYYAYYVFGYDHTRSQSWRKQFDVPIGSLDTSLPIAIPAEQRYEWSGSEGEIPPDVQTRFDEQDFKSAFRLAQLLSIKYQGFIGTADECSDDAYNSTMPQFWVPGKQKVKKKRAGRKRTTEKWTNEQFYYCRFIESRTLLAPNPWMERRMQGIRYEITISSTDHGIVFAIVDAMLKALKNGIREDVVWGIGAAFADMFQQSADGAVPSVPVCNDSSHSGDIEICAECMKLTTHDDLNENDFRYYKICSKCLEAFKHDFKTSEVKGGIIGYALFDLMREEDKASSTKLSLRQIRTTCNDILDKYQHLFITDSRCHDGYVAQTLNVYDPKHRTWHGKLVNARFPTWDAVEPVVVGQDGLTHYHDLSNLTITSFSVNTSVQHHPKILLHALLQFHEANQNGDRTLYENALAIFRNCLINSYECGVFASSQQSQRVGLTPPENMNEISESFRTAKLLERTTPPATVWRSYISLRFGKQAARHSWRPSNLDWLLMQLEWIAEDVFREDASKYRYLWMHKNSKDTEVFFPFSQYSVIDFTWADLFEILCWKIERNLLDCQKPHDPNGDIPMYTPEELLLTIANLWLRMLKKDIDEGNPLHDCGRDEGGLVPQPTIRWLLCASLGHRWHGQTMDLGLVNYDPNVMARVVFDADICGMLWETQCTNFAKSTFPIQQLPAVFGQFRLIRRGNYPPGETRQILPATNIKCDLRVDELNARTTMSSLVRKTMSDETASVQARVTRSLKQTADQLRAQAYVDEELTTSVQEAEVHDPDDVPPIASEIGKEIIVTEPPGPILPPISTTMMLPTHGSDIPQMSNLGHTCFMSSIIHSMAHIPAFMLAFTQKVTFRLETGRNPEQLRHMNDLFGHNHTALYNTLGQLLAKLRKTGPKLGLQETQSMMEACANMRKGVHFNQYDDAASFFDFILSTLDVLFDQSAPLREPDVIEGLDKGGYHRRPAYRPQEIVDRSHLVDLSENKKLSSLQVHADLHWEAHAQSGFSSKFTEATCVQIIQLSQCHSQDCPTVRRDIFYSSKVMLNMPQNLKHSGPIDLDQLMRESFTEQLDPIQQCLNRVKHSALHDSYTTSRITRIARSGVLFVVEINRSRLTMLDEGHLDRSIQEQQGFDAGTESTPIFNRVSNYRRIRMDDWSNNGALLQDKPALGAESPDNEPLTHISVRSEYEIQSVVAFNYQTKHYTSFIKVNDRWLWFDDLQPRPVVRDPFQDWPDGYVETLLWYKQLGPEADRFLANLEADAQLDQTLVDIESVKGMEHSEQPATELASSNVNVMEEEIEHRLRQYAEPFHDRLKKLSEENSQLREENDGLRSINSQLHHDLVTARSSRVSEGSPPPQISADPRVALNQFVNSLAALPDSYMSQLTELFGKRQQQYFNRHGPSLTAVQYAETTEPVTPSRKRSVKRKLTLGNLLGGMGKAETESRKEKDKSDKTRKASRRASFDKLTKMLKPKAYDRPLAAATPSRQSAIGEVDTPPISARRPTAVPTTPPRSVPAPTFERPSMSKRRPLQTVTSVQARTPPVGDVRTDEESLSGLSDVGDSPTKKPAIDRLARLRRDESLSTEAAKHRELFHSTPNLARSGEQQPRGLPRSHAHRDLEALSRQPTVRQVQAGDSSESNDKSDRNNDSNNNKDGDDDDRGKDQAENNK